MEEHIVIARASMNGNKNDSDNRNLHLSQDQLTNLTMYCSDILLNSDILIPTLVDP